MPKGGVLLGRFLCPICSRVYNTSHMLQEHVEVHLQEQTAVAAEGEESYECPMCSLVCSDTSTLQEHVELHLRYGTVEEQRCREQEAKQVVKHKAAEPKKTPVQIHFGLNSYGGRYNRHRIEQTKKAVSRDFHSRRKGTTEAFLPGLDDGRTRTRGMIGALYEYYQREATDCAHVWLSAEADHFCASDLDKGWGCGYRNFQTLLSSLLRMKTFADCLSEKAIPSVPRLQGLIEGAWLEGLDPHGASHFDQRLQGSRAWIGATEIYVLLTYLGARAKVVDFHKTTGPEDTHASLFEWVKQYFSPSTRSPLLRVTQTSQPPLYLQHQGHSRTIVGLEQKRNGTLCLLVLDPGRPVVARELLGRYSAAKAVQRVRKLPAQLKHKQYQVVAVEGTLSPEEKRVCTLKSKTWAAERIP